MSAVRTWNLFVRSGIVAVGILLLGVGAFRAGVIEDERLALWPTFALLHLDKSQGEQSLSQLALIAAVQIVTWTLLAFLLFYVLDAVRRGSRRS
jgi:hypothetical protein